MKNLVIKPGYKGELVVFLQENLGIIPDGVYGPKTKAAVLGFQRANNLTTDGIVGPLTWAAMGVNPLEYFADTDTETSATWIKQHRLPEGEYVKQTTAKKWIFLHHTAGRHNPFKCIDHWAADQRGRVGTHYVIGGLNSILDLRADLTEEQFQYDGKVVQAIDDKYWGYHLGAVKSALMHRASLSIEICSAGILTKADDGTYRTWYNAKVHPSQVTVLDKPYRGSIYYHKYSPNQIKSLKALLLHLRDKHDINLNSGIIAQLNADPENAERAFEYKEEMSRGRISGVLTHGQVRKDKSDVFPQPELIEMLLSL
jgi:N-acetyl-anhydromuramyl-L-alanine amidase AmpD